MEKLKTTYTADGNVKYYSHNGIQFIGFLKSLIKFPHDKQLIIWSKNIFSNKLVCECSQYCYLKIVEMESKLEAYYLLNK